MTLPLPTLDHVVINARDEMDEAADTYRRLGFQLTERGYHSLGSMNHLAIFGTDYLELIAVPKGATSGRLDLLGFPAGLNGLVFGTEDSTSVHKALETAGVAAQPPVEFSRPVSLDGKAHDAVFRTVRLQPGVIPAGRVYFCHHFTRQLVWRDAWREHPNGTVAVVRMAIVEADPPKAAAVYERMFGAGLMRNRPNNGRRLVVGNSCVDLVTPAELQRLYGDAVPDAGGRESYMAALTFRASSIDRVAQALQAGGIAGVRREEARIVVPAAQAWNCTLEFVA